MSARGRGISPEGGQPYTAAALSLVFHPAHPFVPTLRGDIRCFQVCFEDCPCLAADASAVGGMSQATWCRLGATHGMEGDVT